MKVVPSAAGPEAELARLSRPSGPWLHLLDAAPADARQLGWLLGQDGVVVRQLRGACGRSAYGLLDEIGAALQLPGDPAEDWPGLAALLTDMAWLPGTGHVLVVTRASLLLAAEPLDGLRGLVGAVRDVARARAEEGDPLPFHVVLQDDAVGLAALRARLDAVRARYAELAGWEASEPAVEAAPSGRSVLTGGPLDDVDRAVAGAAAGVDGVRSVGRVWEDFRGGSAGPVRTYVPLLGGPVDVAAVAAAVAGAVAAAGASCVVVPAPADLALADARQSALAAAATEIWPDPPEPEPATPEPEPAILEAAILEAATPEPAAPEAAAPDAATVESAISGSGTAVTGPVITASAPPDSATPEPPAAQPVPADSAAQPSADPSSEGRPAEQAPGPHDRPGAGFELIAANLQWPFDTGSEENDAVDTALLAHAAAGGRTAALFRTWVQDPDGSWVRVVLGYVARSSIADVEAERTALVDALQRSGAARCCVEVLAATDVSDAHRWLEQRCRPLWPVPPPPTDPPPTADHPTPERADQPTAAPSPADHPARVRADQPTAAPSPADQPAAAATTADQSSPALRPADVPAAADAGPAAGEPGGFLSADATFRPGPAADDPAHAAVLGPLLDWATARPGVVAVLTAYSGDRLVVGVALDGDTDPDQVRAGAPSPVEPFAPSRGLAPVHLRLSRGSTRVWTRRAERAAPEPARASGDALDRPTAPKVTNLGPPPVRDTEDARGDETLGDFVLVGIDRSTEIAKGPPEPDEPDAALVAWATAEPAVTALLRAHATVGEATIPVYTVALAEGTDPVRSRTALAAAIAATGTPKAAAEAFDPAGALSTFHLDLAVGSTRLWPRRT